MPRDFSFRSTAPNIRGAFPELTVKSLGRLMGTAQPAAAPEDNRAPIGPRGSKAPSFGSASSGGNSSTPSHRGTDRILRLVPFCVQVPAPQASLDLFPAHRLCLAAFLQPLTAHSKIDNADWWTQMPYHTYTNLIFATLSGLGAGLLILGWPRGAPTRSGSRRRCSSCPS